jgi:hypothetical protein
MNFATRTTHLLKGITPAEDTGWKIWDIDRTPLYYVNGLADVVLLLTKKWKTMGKKKITFLDLKPILELLEDAGLFLLPWGRRSEQLWLLLDVFLETNIFII